MTVFSDPLTGQLIDAPFGQISSTPLTYTTTGTWLYRPVVVLTLPRNVNVGESAILGNGKWAESFIYTEGNVSNVGLQTLSLPDLNGLVGGLFVTSMYLLTTLSLPSLTTVGGACSLSTMASLTTLSLPSLTTVGGACSPSTMASLTTLSLPSLQVIGSVFAPSTMASLTSLSLPALVTIGSTISVISGTAALTTFTIGDTLKSAAGDVTITSAALTQASVDGLLARFAALDGTNGTAAYSSPNVITITGTSATPSAAGLASKATLVARGVTVTHN